jgi:hypothetical protein
MFVEADVAILSRQCTLPHKHQNRPGSKLWRLCTACDAIARKKNPKKSRRPFSDRRRMIFAIDFG